MRLNLKEILNGWRNHLFPPEKLREFINQVSEERLTICRECEYNSENMKKAGKKFTSSFRPDEHCTVCHCPLIQKTKSLHTNCPLEPPKWDRIATPEESAEISNTLQDAS